MCRSQNRSLFKYIDEDSLSGLYRSAKKNAEQFGWHGLGDIVYTGARLQVRPGFNVVSQKCGLELCFTVISHMSFVERYMNGSLPQVASPDI